MGARSSQEFYVQRMLVFVAIVLATPGEELNDDTLVWLHLASMGVSRLAFSTFTCVFIIVLLGAEAGCQLCSFVISHFVISNQFLKRASSCEFSSICTSFLIEHFRVCEVTNTIWLQRVCVRAASVHRIDSCPAGHVGDIISEFMRVM